MILCRVKETGACWSSKDNQKLVIVVYSADLAHLTTWSAFGAAALQLFGFDRIDMNKDM